MTSILVVIALFLLIVLVHELGHFIMAKRSGAKVEEFGFGFPPRLFGFQRGETMYSFNLLPLGGFVKIFGEGGEERLNPRSFSAKPISVRAFIILAGVAMNVLLAVVLYSVGHGVGLPTIIEDSGLAARAKDVYVQIVDIANNSPAKEAGLQGGDIILAISADSTREVIKDTRSVKDITARFAGRKITFEVKRGAEKFTADLTPRQNPPEGEGAVGIAMVRVGTIAYPWYEAPWRGIQTTYSMLGALVVGIFSIFKHLVTAGSFNEEVAGPVGIAVLVSHIQRLGLIYLLQFAALLSLNLAIINIIPFPALDGGRFLFLIIEKIKGSPVNQRVEGWIHAGGFVLLIVLMIFLTIRDVGKIM